MESVFFFLNSKTLNWHANTFERFAKFTSVVPLLIFDAIADDKNEIDLCVFVIVLLFTDNRLLDTTYELKSLNLKLSVENEQLRTGSVAPSNGTSAAAAAKISQLESKLLTQQEQLTDLHKRKGENAQMIIDLNLKLEKQNKLLGERETR